MSRDDAASPQAEVVQIKSLEEKMEAWAGWDDSKWKPDWMRVYSKSVSWAAGGGLAGALHALTTGRSILPNAVLFAGYTTVISGCYFATREAIFGREIERFRQESLALGLPEVVAREYPWRWDVLCGGIAGAVAGMMGGHKPSMIAASSALFASGILAIRFTSSAFSDYVLPVMLPDEYQRLERGRQSLVLTDAEIKRLELAQEDAAMNSKAKIWQYIPSWSPFQVYTKKEHQDKQEDKDYDNWLQKEVEAKRLAVGIKRRVKQLEEKGESAALGSVPPVSPGSPPSTSTSSKTPL